ncbi:hypothetical protein [Burkholderia ubonensis]|uniref:hypothetical protein n=1 Tax=Burkholderia ubonensis TaxID=101571 RepID=UPI0012FAED08|nr:hypothetical protein [Burkholderia ubonensis]
MKFSNSIVLKAVLLGFSLSACHVYAAGSSMSLSCTASNGGTCSATGNQYGTSNVSSFYWQGTNVSMTILNGNSVNVACQRPGLGFVNASTAIDGNTGIPLLSATAVISCP